MKKILYADSFVTLLLTIGVLAKASAAPPEELHAACESLPISEFRIIGSHNSYRIMPPRNVLLALDSIRPGLMEKLEYEHPAFQKQLDLGLRLLEIDLYADPEGGRYEHSPNLEFLQPDDPVPFTTSEIMQPGFKVMHIQGYDNYSHCVLLTDCLEELKIWSDLHFDHTPILVTLNVKEDQVFEDLPVPLEFNADRLQELDDTLLAVFGRDRLIVPDDIRGNARTLRDAVLENGWPTVSDSRGKFMFVLDEAQPAASLVYRIGHASLKDRIMFASYPASDDEAAFMVFWDIFGSEQEVASLVEQGFLVRVSSDINTREARTDDMTRLQAAIDSGAQFIASDYYPGNISPFETDYVARFSDGGVTQCGSR